MDISIIGFTLDVIGKVLLGISVYLVHSKVIRERKINKKVLGKMKKRTKFGINWNRTNNHWIFNAATSKIF